MNLDPFFLFIGVLAAITACSAFGVSIAIVARLVRERRSKRMRQVILVAISWNLFACLFTYRFWLGVYNPHLMRDRITLFGVLIAFTAGGWAIYSLWTNPLSKGDK